MKQIDDDMLYYDLTVLLNMDIDQEEPYTHIHIDFEPVPFEKVENEYLSLFYGLIRAL